MRRLMLVGWFWLGIGIGILVGTVWLEHTHAQALDVQDAIHQAAINRNVSEAWLRRITWCESRYQPWVTSRGGHMGLAQFAPRTWYWMSAQAGHAGESAYEPYAAADTLAWGLANGFAGHWACR